MDRILITGATGFIGSNIASFFSRKGLEVTCFVRKSGCREFLKDLPVKWALGDITDIHSLTAACKDADFVIHTAALATDWGRYDTFYRVNVTGTLNVLKACSHWGIQNIIMTGSISSYGEEDSGVIKHEGHPYRPNYPYFLNSIFPCGMNHYRNTKALATAAAIEYAEAGRMNLTILEPTWVYGENEFGTGFYEYMKNVKSGFPYFPGSRRNKFHVIYVSDLARAVYMAYQKKLSGVNRIIIGNQQSESMDRLYSLFCRELGVRKPKNLPRFITYPIGFMMELIYTVFAMKAPPFLTRGRVNMFYDNIEYSVKKARQKLSFVNEFSLEEGIHRTVHWYKKKGLI